MRSALPYWASTLCKEIRQRRAIGGVARQNLVGEREAFRRDDQGDDDLHTVVALVAAVAVAALVVLIIRRIGFEIRAGQIIQQHFKARSEQVLPALAQMTEQHSLMRQELVKAAVESILLHQPIV